MILWLFAKHKRKNSPKYKFNKDNSLFVLNDTNTKAILQESKVQIIACNVRLSDRFCTTATFLTQCVNISFLMQSLRIRTVGFVLLLWLVLLYLTVTSATAQEYQWSLPQRVPDYEDEARAPFMVVDQNQTVHAFSQNSVDGMIAVTYRQWSLDQGWTPPTDVLLLPGQKPLVMIGAFLDQRGIVHIVCFGGNDRSADLYYAQAPLERAAQATAWSYPRIIGEAATSPASGDIVGDGEGNLFVLYSGRLDGNGVYALHSTDGGATWSEPVAIFLSYRGDDKPWSLYTYLDDAHRLHIVWTVVNGTGNGQAIYYTQVTMEGNKLRRMASQKLAIIDGQSANYPSIIGYHDQLIVIYQNSKPVTRFMRLSSDNGQTWTDPVRLFPHIGDYGPASLVKASNQQVHMLLGNRINDPATGINIHGMWHSVWQGNAWSELAPVIAGPAVKPTQGDIGEGFDPHFPRAVVSQGNLILVTWSNDHGFNGVWHSALQLDSPALPVMALPTVMPTAVVQPTPTATATAPAVILAVSPLVERTDRAAPAQALPGPLMLLAIGLAPALLLINIVIIVHILHRARQKETRSPR